MKSCFCTLCPLSLALDCHTTWDHVSCFKQPCDPFAVHKNTIMNKHSKKYAAFKKRKRTATVDLHNCTQISSRHTSRTIDILFTQTISSLQRSHQSSLMHAMRKRESLLRWQLDPKKGTTATTWIVAANVCLSSEERTESDMKAPPRWETGRVCLSEVLMTELD